MLQKNNPFLNTPQPLDEEALKKRSIGFLFFWVMYLLLSPFYIFNSGLPQPADILIFTGIIIFFSYRFLTSGDQDNANITGVYIFGGIFVGLTTSINLIHYFFTPDVKFMLHSIYYFFNFLIFVFGILIFRSYPKMANYYSYWAVVIICILEFLVVMFFPDMEDYRASGTFNRSNQLAYWGILTAAALLILKRTSPITLLDLLLLAMIGYIEMKALSKAGIIVYFMLLMIAFISPNITKKMRWIAFICFTVLMLVKFQTPQNVAVFIQKIETLEAVSDRMKTLGKQADDTPAGRGYDRLIEHPQFLIVGAGEGAHWRFGRQELHSGIATLIFSYSIFGFGVFVLFLGSVFYRLPWHYTAMLIPIFMYGLTHQNVRFSYFWVFLALAYSWHFIKREEDGGDQADRLEGVSVDGQ